MAEYSRVLGEKAKLFLKLEKEAELIKVEDRTIITWKKDLQTLRLTFCIPCLRC